MSRQITWTATDEAGETFTAQTAIEDATGWRGWPWSGTQSDDPFASANALFMDGPRPADPSGAYLQPGPLNNGYSLVVEDPTGQRSSKATFCVAPGDAGWVPAPGNPTRDTRAEVNRPGSLPDDFLANASWETVYIRFACRIPSVFSAPVPVQNAQRAGWIAYQQARGNLARWPDGVHVNPSTGAPSASALVTNTRALVILLSNLMEDEGPAVFAWMRGYNAGVNGSLIALAYQPVSLGVGLTGLNIDTIPLTFDTRYDVLTEIKPGLYATSDGQPWIVAPGAVTGPRSVPWSTSSPVAPYGVPPGVPGGGSFRQFRFTPADPTYGDCWRCKTENHPYAIPGEAPVLDTAGRVLNASTCVPNAGQIPGPTLKGNGAKLLGGPDGAMGSTVALKASTRPPFDIFTTSPVAVTGFHPTGGEVSLGAELMTFASADNANHKLHITARGILGTTPADHTPNEQIVGLSAPRCLSVGINAAGYRSATNYGLSAPIAAELWPPRVSRAPSFTCGAPAPNYP